VVNEELINRMWRFALSVLGDGEEAKDVVQNVLLRSFNRVLIFNNEEAYLMRAVRNACIDSIRSRKYWAEEETGLVLEEYSHESRDTGELVRFAISRLGLKQRMAVQLKDIEGYSTEDVARILGVKENQVRTILSRARMKMKAIIEKELD